MAGPGRPKGSNGINKSAKIREYLEAHPDSTTTEVIEVLAQQGIDVSQPLVVGVRSRAFGRKKKRGEITISEIESLNSQINETYEDREIVGQVLDHFETWAGELGGWDRFVTAMRTALKNESVVASSDCDDDEDCDSDTNEYEEDQYEDEDEDEDDDEDDDDE